MSLSPRSASRRSDECSDLGADAVADEVAFSQYYDRHCAPVYAIALRVLADESLAQDVTVAAFLTAWQRAAHRASTDQPSLRWLLRLTHGLALSARRRAAPPALDPAASATADRTALEQAFWGGLSYREVAAKLHNGPREVLGQLRAGMRLLAAENPGVAIAQTCCAQPTGGTCVDVR